MCVIDHYDRGDCRVCRVVEWTDNLGFNVAATLTREHAVHACGYIACEAYESLLGAMNRGGWMRIPLGVPGASVVPGGNMHLH